MAVVVRDETIGGVPYRITEDEETGYYSKVCLIEPEAPEPEPDDLVVRVEQLEGENAFIAMELVSTQIRLDQSEQEQADMLLALVMKGVL